MLRGWVVAQLLLSHRGSSGWGGLIPVVHGSHATGAVITLALVVLSVLIGRRSPSFSQWPRRIGYLASAAIAVWGLAILAPAIGGTHYDFQGVSAGVVQDSTGNVNDVYVYDENGNAVPGARLYDQNGNQIQLGSPYCADGSTGSGVVGPDGTNDPNDPNAYSDPSQTWTYPLCPNDPGPFRSGPGAVAPTPSASATAPVTPTMPATPTAPTPSGKATAAASSAPGHS